MAGESLMVGSFLVGAVEHFFIVRRHGETWLTEEAMRRHLTDAGLTGEEIDRQFTRARAMREWAEKHYVERPTAIGYCNEHAQTVVRKTDTAGSRPFERIFVLHCQHCGGEYGVDGCDIAHRRCPHCQGGDPALTALPAAAH